MKFGDCAPVRAFFSIPPKTRTAWVSQKFIPLVDIVLQVALGAAASLH